MNHEITVYFVLFMALLEYRNSSLLEIYNKSMSWYLYVSAQVQRHFFCMENSLSLFFQECVYSLVF